MYKKPEPKQYSMSVEEAQHLRSCLTLRKQAIEELSKKRMQLSGYERGQITRQITPLQEEIEEIEAKLVDAPPEPVAHKQALEIVAAKLAMYQQDWQDAVRKMAEAAEGHYALQYSGCCAMSELVTAETLLKVLRPLYNYMDNWPNVRMDVAVEILQGIYDRLVDELIRDGHLHNSTDPMSNTVNMLEHNAKSNFLSLDLEWWLCNAYDMLERTKAHDEWQKYLDMDAELREQAK